MRTVSVPSFDEEATNVPSAPFLTPLSNSKYQTCMPISQKNLYLQARPIVALATRKEITFLKCAKNHRNQ